MSASTQTGGLVGRHRVLVVGSWAKEQITIEHLRQVAGAEVYACLEIENPAIVDLVDGHRILAATDIDGMLAYAGEVDPDLVLVTTAEPLQHGLADALEDSGINCFGPRRRAARLEWDKAFARDVVDACCPEVNPEHRAFTQPDDAKAWAAERDWQVAVKPAGLTSGLGVRVAGDQLADEQAVADYIDQVGAAVLEERLIGDEFALQALVAGAEIVTTPLVQDFKKLLPGDRGPNTASMGSYSRADGLLPFLEDRDDILEQAKAVLRSTLATLESQHDVRATGFLYGQFMFTTSGLKLIEYNFRPGDPEWLNVMATLDGSLLEAIENLLAGRPSRLEFRSRASVVKYLVPPDYPREMDQVLHVRLDRERLAALGVQPYTSAGLDAEGRLNVGEERGIALLACGDTPIDAHLLIERAIESAVSGRFHHRGDIGSTDSLGGKTAPELRSA